MSKGLAGRLETIGDRLAQTLLETAPYLIIVFRRMSLTQKEKRKTIITFRKVLA
jgi:hypothetical protein